MHYMNMLLYDSRRTDEYSCNEHLLIAVLCAEFHIGLQLVVVVVRFCDHVARPLHVKASGVPAATSAA